MVHTLPRNPSGKVNSRYMGNLHRRRILVARLRSGLLLAVVSLIGFAAFTCFDNTQAQNPASGVVNALAFADAQRGVAVGSGGLAQRTEDGGITWNRFQLPLAADLTGVAFADAQHGMIVGRNANTGGRGEIVARTQDGGRTWQQVGEVRAEATPVAAVPLNLIAIAYPDAQHARAVGETTDGRGAFLKTDDGGGTWQRLPTNTDDALRGVSFVDAANGWLVGEGGTILHTTDGGQTWTLQGGREDTSEHRAVFFLDGQRGWIVGANGDIHRTTNGGATWERANAGTTADLIGVRFRDERQGYVLAGDGQMLQTTDGGASWQPIAEGAPPNVRAFALRPDGVPVIANAAGGFALLQTPNAPPAVASPQPSPQLAPSPAATPSVYEQVRNTPTPLGTRLIGLVGILVLLGATYLMSNNRRAIRWGIVAWGLGLQLIFALFIMRTRIGFAIFNSIGEGVKNLLAFSDAGAQFVFGRLADPAYIEQVSRTVPDSIAFANRFGLIFAFKILPTIIFVASLFAILYYLGIMQRIVYAMAWVMARTMRVSGAESLSSAANVFMGQTEAPLVIAPYIRAMTQSELLAVMIGGMATVSGGVLAAYIGLGVDPVFLLTGSVMAAPASLMVAKMLFPETETPETAGSVQITTKSTDANLIDAASRGAGEGMQLAINVAAMLIAFIALIALVNAVLGYLGGVTGFNAALGRPFDLGLIFGYLFAPLAFVMGVPAADILNVGSLFGTKLVLNEFVAYLRLSPAGENVQALLQPRSVLIVTYALCGFANFSSIGIQIGGIGGLAPERRSDLARLGLRALFGGFVATCLTATIAGLLS